MSIESALVLDAIFCFKEVEHVGTSAEEARSTTDGCSAMHDVMVDCGRIQGSATIAAGCVTTFTKIQ